MLSEYHNDYKRVVAVAHAGRGGRLLLATEVYAQEYYRAMLGVSEFLYGDLGAALQSGMLRRVRVWLQHIFLPNGYPNSVSDDLLPVALWDLVQLVCSNVTSTLAMRALLLTAGVGEATASLTSSTLSWVLRDGVRMLASVLFASHVSVQLDYRCKTWRLVADVANDIANFMEVVSPWMPALQLRVLTVVLASALRAVVGVAGAGTRAAMTQHFAKVGNAADVTATTSNRDNAGSLAGLLLGSVVAYATPARSRRATLLAFVLFSLVHGLANYQAIRATVLRQLNAPRVEWCLRRYYALEASMAAVRAVRDRNNNNNKNNNIDGAAATSSAQPRALRESFALPPWRANREEALLLVAPLSPHALQLPQTQQLLSSSASSSSLPPPWRSLHAAVMRTWLRGRLQLRRLRTLLLPQLHVHVHYGVSLYELLRDAAANNNNNNNNNNNKDKDNNDNNKHNKHNNNSDDSKGDKSDDTTTTSAVRTRHGLTADTRRALVARVEECLLLRGVALLYDAAEFVYYVVFAEKYTTDGHPQSWRIYHEQAEQLRSIVVAGAAAATAASTLPAAMTSSATAAAVTPRRASHAHAKHDDKNNNNNDNNNNKTSSSSGEDERDDGKAASAQGVVEADDASAASEIQHVCDDMNATAAALGDTRIRSSSSNNNNDDATAAHMSSSSSPAAAAAPWQRMHRLYGGGEYTELAYSQLWAYFYAYSHQRACGFPAHAAARRAALHRKDNDDNNKSNNKSNNNNKTGNATPGIIACRDASADEAAVTLHVIASLRADGVLDLNRQVCHRHHYDADDDDDGHAASSTQAFADDELYPSFMHFVRTLVRSGWVLDRLLVADAGWRIGVQHA